MDTANLLITVDSTGVTRGTAALDGLSAAGARAEAAAVAVGVGTRGAAAGATAMAAEAQLASRASMDFATGLRASESAARVNTLAMRETLVVTRELARGNYTRIPGSLTLLAQGIGSQGGLSAFAQAIGLIKKVQDAERAEAVVAASSAAAGVEAAVRRAGANVMLTETEIELAQAQMRVAKGAVEEAAAQARLAAANEAAAEAAGQATLAENALAVALGRVKEKELLAAASAKTTLGTTGAVLVGVTIAATGLVLGFEAIKKSVSDSGVLKDYAESLGLSAQQMEKLKEKTNDFALTFGDVWHGIKKAGEDALDQSSAWSNFKSGNESAFKTALSSAVNFASQSYGYVAASYDSVVALWHQFPNELGSAFVSAVNAAIIEINKLIKASADGINSLIHGINNIPGVHIGDVGAKQIALVGGSTGPSKPQLSFAADQAKRAAEAKASINKNLDTIYGDIVDAAEERIKKEGGRPPKGKHARQKHPGDHGLEESLDKLDAEIKGQLALAAAYQVSDAAAMKAVAMQKAEEDAIKHKSQTGVFYEKELQKAVAESAAAGGKMIANLRFETGARKEANDAVAAGTMTRGQANEQLKLETELRSQNAALSVEDDLIAQTRLALAHAEGAQKATLLAQLAQEIAERATLAGVIKGVTKEQKDANAETARTIALDKIKANDNEIERLRLEATLIGASNKERAIAIAQLQEEQALRGTNTPVAERDRLMAQAGQIAGMKNRSPLQQWADSAAADAAKINDALQGIEVHGLDQLSSAITDVITGAKSLKTAFSEVAKSIISEIVQMIVKMLIFRAVSAILGGGQWGSLYGQANAGDMAVNLPSSAPLPSLGAANGAAFFGGNIIPFASGGIVGGPTMFGMSGGRTGLMGEAGPEAVMPLARDGSGRLGVRAANTNQPIEVHVTVEASPELDARIANVSANQIAGAAPIIVKAAVQQTLRAAERPKLMGGR